MNLSSASATGALPVPGVLAGEPVQVLMVCMGNICRSPTAEVVLRDLAARAGVAVVVDSAGTHAGHWGHPPDPRSCRHAALRGYDLTGLRARGLQEADFDRFHLLVAMDQDNLMDLRERCPEGRAGRLVRLLDFAAQPPQRNVPDPYYGGEAGFDRVLDLIELGCTGLVEYLRRHQG
ncbi:MAG: hypothetical protein RL722_2991 [Pseudomonadota bacterium]|jgi:protein-tyrosine phosphatase